MPYLDSCDEYCSGDNPFFGTTVGRTAGRINPPHMTIDGIKYTLAGSDGGGGGIDRGTNLHGGNKGFNKFVWEIADRGESFVVMTRLSPDGEEGFPGSLQVHLCYRLVGSALRMEYSAKCVGADAKTTPVSLTNHTYFNLAAGRSPTMMEHTLQLECHHYHPGHVSGSGIPTGERAAVAGRSGS
jgi:aldose 1-epimerase